MTPITLLQPKPDTSDEDLALLFKEGQNIQKYYSQELSRLKCEEVYQHIYDSYYGQGQSVYAKAS